MEAKQQNPVSLRSVFHHGERRLRSQRTNVILEMIFHPLPGAHKDKGTCDSLLEGIVGRLQTGADGQIRIATATP